MEYLIFVGIFLVVIIVSIYLTVSQSDWFYKLLWALWLVLISILLGVGIRDYKPIRIVIEKSSDSDWIISNNQQIKRDTIITTPKLFIKGTDTIITLPTVEYRIIKRKQI